ncbi:hypothetical protein MASR1M32_00870 [Rhodobacter sp.]
MTKAIPTETIRISRKPVADRRPDPRRMAWLATAGALAVALLLGVGLPARAAGSDQGAAGVVQVWDKRPKPHSQDWVEPGWQRDRKPRIPAVCAMEFDNGRRVVTVFPERCLRREGVEARLPVQCAKVARIWGKRDRVYSARCLTEAGFRIGGGYWRDDRSY